MGMTINSTLSQHYIDVLDQELTKAKTSLECFAKAATKAKREHDLANEYYLDLKGYCTQVSATYVHISDLYDYLNTLVTKTGCVGDNLKLSLESLGIIARMLKCLCEEVETLKASVHALIEAIDAIDSEVLKGDGATLVSCLRQLEDEINVALGLLCDAISAVIILYRCVLELTHSIGSKDGETLTGLVLELEEMRKVLCCNYCAGINNSLTACDVKDLGENVEAELNDCCENPREMRDCQCEITKPDVCDGGFSSSFFQNDIKQAMDDAKLLVEHKKCVWQFFEKKRAGVQAEHDAVKKSYDAAKAAKALCA
jgi:hypothetical protein